MEKDRAGQSHGRLNIGDVVGQRNDAGAYLFATVQANQDGEAVFNIGSDDVVCWLNGAECTVHRRPRLEPRSGQSVSSETGNNSILLKVLNAGGGGRSVYG